MGTFVGQSLGYSTIYSRSNIPHADHESQKVILIAGIDNIERQNSSVESVWLALFIPDIHTISLVPIFPPSSQSMPTLSEVIPEIDSFITAKKIDKSFIKILNKAGVYWDNYVIIDGQGWSELVHFIRGQDQGSSIFEITSAGLNSSNQNHDPDTLISWQAYRFQQICSTINSNLNNVDANQIPESKHILSDISRRKLKNTWKQIFGPENALYCKFPTMSQ